MASAFASIVTELKTLTANWNQTDLVPKDQQEKCKDIGRRLNEIGGVSLMRDAYYAAHGANRCASVIQAYWDGIGDWRW